MLPSALAEMQGPGQLAWTLNRFLDWAVVCVHAALSNLSKVPFMSGLFLYTPVVILG